jgi:riboflavin synthase
MFTGLIETVGVVRRKAPRGAGMELTLAAEGPRYELKEGDSVAVSGVCLTATAVDAAGFSVDVSAESLARSTLGAIAVGRRVNLERALRLGDRMGGHLVTGHIDAVGRVAELRRETGFMRLAVAAPPEVMRLTVAKGSIAVDGISLTVNAVAHDRFELMLIPETISRTTLAEKKPGDPLNLETDLIGKYVARLLGREPGSDQALLQKLKEEGFL